MSNNSKERFSGRVDSYVKYRPGYPDDVIKYLEGSGVLNHDSVIADIGSGTGISAEIFLNNGNEVFAVEPNFYMRSAAEKLLKQYKRFNSVNGTAEASTLKTHSIDLIICAQAFHWFNLKESKSEFKRILKPGGKAVLIWNRRLTDSTPFLKDYEKLLLKYGTDYKDVRHENVDKDKIRDFFNGEFEFKEFPNSQHFGLDGVKGRLMSSSYSPAKGDEGFDEMISELERIFEKHNILGKIDIRYSTEVYSGFP